MVESTHYLKTLADAEATEAFGQRLGCLLFPGAVIALIGELGAGKTTLTRGIAQGLGISDPKLVSSPTFTLIHEYPTQPPITHVDVYRLASEQEFHDLGAAEILASGHVCVIEWADRVLQLLPKDRLTVRLEHGQSLEHRHGYECHRSQGPGQDHTHSQGHGYSRSQSHGHVHSQDHGHGRSYGRTILIEAGGPVHERVLLALMAQPSGRR